MKWITLFGAVLAAAAQWTLAANDSMPKAAQPAFRGSLSPSAPVNLTYQVEHGIAGQPQRIDVTITTPLSSGILRVEVVKHEGAELLSAAEQQIDLATAARPIPLHMQAIQLGTGEHFLVLLLTVETGMGPMSRSFRIDLAPAASGNAQ